MDEKKIVWILWVAQYLSFLVVILSKAKQSFILSCLWTLDKANLEKNSNQVCTIFPLKLWNVSFMPES